MLSCLISFYTEHIMWNSELDESQTGIKIARRNISNLRYAYDITLMAETEEQLKYFLMRLKWANGKKKKNNCLETQNEKK